jgi:hypothetical protein
MQKQGDVGTESQSTLVKVAVSANFSLFLNLLLRLEKVTIGE